MNRKDDKTDEKNCVENKQRNKTVWLGYFMSLLTTIFSASGNFFLKITNENKMTVVLIRNGLQFLFLLPVLTWRKTDLIVMDAKLMVLVFFRGVVGSVLLIFIGLSMNYLSLGDAMAIFYTYPVFVGFFACLCLKEKCGILNIILTITTVIGFVLVAQPSFIFGKLSDFNGTKNNSFRMIGASLALLSAIMASLSAVTLRRIGIAVHFTQSMLHIAWEGTLLSGIFIAASGTALLPCFKSFPTILGCSLSFFCAQICRTIALQHEKAATVTLIQTSQIIFSFLLQYIFLNEVPNLLGFAGASLILTSSIAFGIKNILKSLKLKK